jgi:hypothetical protein
MNCVEFGVDRSRGFGSARGQFWPIAIDRPTRPYSIASTTVHQVMFTARLLHGLDELFGLHVVMNNNESSHALLLAESLRRRTT